MQISILTRKPLHLQFKEFLKLPVNHTCLFLIFRKLILFNYTYKLGN